MKMTLMEATVAARIMGELSNQLFPGMLAKAIYDNRVALLKQANFLEEEETKLIESYGATRLDGGVVKVMGDSEKNSEFIRKMRDVQSMEVEVETVPIREDELLRYAQIRPDDIGKIKGLLKVVEGNGTV